MSSCRGGLFQEVLTCSPETNPEVMLELGHTGCRKDGKTHTLTPEQIITKLREAEVYLSQEKTVGQACKALEISEQTYYPIAAGWTNIRIGKNNGGTSSGQGI